MPCHSVAVDSKGEFVIKLFSAWILLFSSLAWGQGFHQLPGFIPLKYQRQAASDLVYKGRVLLPDEARHLFESGEVQDLSLLNPDTTSVLWKDIFLDTLNANSFSLDLKKTKEIFQFRSYITSPIGLFRFSADATNQKGVPGTYTIRVGPRMHNILLRKALLEKIGYSVPNLQYMKSFRVQFDGAFSRNNFLDKMERGNFIESSRWITIPEDESFDVIFHDAVVLMPQPPFYDLSQGQMPAQVIGGRRLLNSLIVPFNLLDIPESVNAYLWHPGRVVNEQLNLAFDGARNFTTSYEDARWVARRILSLSRKDLAEVVGAAEFPEVVGELVLEKLISRRNFLRRVLKLESEFQDIRFDDQITRAPFLVDGKLLRDRWEGFGVRFAHDDPESPLGKGEMGSLFKSKALSNLIGHLFRTINTDYIPHTNIAEEVFLHQIDLAGKQFAEFIGTGEVTEIPFGFWSTPFYGGNIIASRDIVAGSYLGTDNLVQLADTVGFNMNTGIFALADGMPTGYSLNTQAQVYFTTTYTHLKPITSIKIALKEPLSNMIVPLLMNKYGEVFDDLSGNSDDTLTEEERQERVSGILKVFKENLGIGESLIVSRIYGGGIDIGAGYSISERIEAQAGFNVGKQKFSRLHILRVNDDTIHIYKDPAKVGTWGMWVGLQAEIQVFRLGFKNRKGKAGSRFYKVNINPDMKENPEVASNLLALQRVLEERKTDYLDLLQDPFVVEHKFKERAFDVSLFHWRWLTLNSVDGIRVQTPDKQSRDYVRAAFGKRKGKNYEELGLDVINQLLEEHTEEDIVIASTSTGDPGDTIFGRSQSRLAVLDVEVTPLEEEEKGEIGEAYSQITYKWKGWEISSKKMSKILDNLSEFYGFEIFPDTILAQTDEIKLYTLNLYLSIYDSGIDHLLSLGREEVEAIFRAYPRISLWVDDGKYELRGSRERRRRQEEYRQNVIGGFFRSLKKYEKHLRKSQKSENTNDLKHIKDAVKDLNEAISTSERLVSQKGLFLLFGGKENIFIQAELQGFKAGDELGDKPFFSNSLGQIGHEKVSGPLYHVQRKIGMTESEFFIYWLLNRI